MKYLILLWRFVRITFWAVSAIYIIGGAYTLFPKVVSFTDECLAIVNKQIANNFVNSFELWLGKIGVQLAPVWFLIFAIVIAYFILRYGVIKKRNTHNPKQEKSEIDKGG